ncbi:MAG: RNA polymerase sigma factor [Alphaproteobacteria bacterium]
MAISLETLQAASEVMVVGLAQTGDAQAFAELVRRRQSWLRNLMRRFCGDAILADDLAQDVFLQAWQKIDTVQQVDRFGGWLRTLALNIWLQYLRKKDALREAAPEDETAAALQGAPSGLKVDLDRALAMIAPAARTCVVLNYHEGLTHTEIAEATGMALGTVKSHITRGGARLKELLAAYENEETAV